MLEEFIEVNNLSATIFECEDSHTAAKAIEATGDADAVAKSIVLLASNCEPVLVILLGKDKIDLQKVKAVLGVKDVRLCQEKEVFEMTGYEVGGVPPISIYGIKTIMDKAVAEKAEIVCGGGDSKHLMRIKVNEIIEAVDGIVFDDIAKK